MNTFKPFETSSPRDDLAKTPEALRHRPAKLRNGASLQQCDRTKLLQWYTPAPIGWRPVGEMFGIKGT